jgi:hypothetical protein
MSSRSACPRAKRHRFRNNPSAGCGDDRTPCGFIAGLLPGTSLWSRSLNGGGAAVIQTRRVGGMKTVWIGAFALALLGSADAGWALPAAPATALEAAGPSGQLLLIRHHRHRGHGRHSRSRWWDGEPGEAMPGTVTDPPYGSGTSAADPPAASASPRASSPEPPPAATPNRPRRGSGSPPAIRWVDPEKSPR